MPGPEALYRVVPIVFVVEVAGHFIKPAALAIRLFANMVAGHTLMAVLLGFGVMALPRRACRRSDGARSRVVTGHRRGGHHLP